MSLWSVFAWALPATACTCAPFEGLKSLVGDRAQLVFSGTIASLEGDGAVVAVDRWYQGTGEPIVRLAGEFGGQSGACHVFPPPVRSRWLYVAYISALSGLPNVNSCSPQGRLDHGGDPTGFEMETEAIAVFGAGRTPLPIETQTDPPATVTSVSAPEVIVLIATGMGAAVVLLFGGLLLIARRRSP